MVKIKNKTAIDTNLKPCKDGYERVAKLVCEEKCKTPRKRDPTTNQCATPATVTRNKKISKGKKSAAQSKSKKASKKTCSKKVKPKSKTKPKAKPKK